MIYAINRKTKEHRIVPRPDILSNADWYYTQADSDGWIEWSGDDDGPLPDEAKCMIRMDSDEHGQPTDVRKSIFWCWGVVTHYRPILEPQAEQVKEWRGPEVGVEVSHPTGRGIVMLPPDANGVTIIMSTNDDDYVGEYKRVAACACKSIQTDRERWIEAAKKECIIEISDRQLGKFYDAGLARLAD